MVGKTGMESHTKSVLLYNMTPLVMCCNEQWKCCMCVCACGCVYVSVSVSVCECVYECARVCLYGMRLQFPLI